MATTTTTRLRLSPHFTIEEFDCHDGTKVPAAAVAALKVLCRDMLEPLRAKYGSCTVVSGFRTSAHNAAVGGVAKSEHKYHEHPATVAADVRFATGSVADWANSARWRFDNKQCWTAKQRGGCGDYPSQGFLHVDSGKRRNWHG
jgi:uncharacterized protein YcbK (DUF882 family)